MKIVSINMLMMILCWALFLYMDESMHNEFTIWGFGLVILILFILNLLVGIVTVCIAQVKGYAKYFFLSAFLVLLIGIPCCFISPTLKGN